MTFLKNNRIQQPFTKSEDQELGEEKEYIKPSQEIKERKRDR